VVADDADYALPAANPPFICDRWKLMQDGRSVSVVPLATPSI
jgi:hypothetical protein